MGRLITHALAALVLATSCLSAPAFAQSGRGEERQPPRHDLRPPPPADAQWDRDRGPPPSWDQRQWQYRQDYLRRRHHDENDHQATVGLIAGIILGFALGAAVTDTPERQNYAQQRLDDRDWVRSCANRYRSFDPQTGTYLGYDGLRHYCR